MESHELASSWARAQAWIKTVGPDPDEFMTMHTLVTALFSTSHAAASEISASKKWGRGSSRLSMGPFMMSINYFYSMRKTLDLENPDIAREIAENPVPSSGADVPSKKRSTPRRIVPYNPENETMPARRPGMSLVVGANSRGMELLSIALPQGAVVV